MIISYDGKEYEFLGYTKEEADPRQATHFLGHVSLTLRSMSKRERVGTSSPTALFREIRPRHTFGGVVFEETGDERHARQGEWLIGFGSAPCVWVYESESSGIYRILKPVEVL